MRASGPETRDADARMHRRLLARGQRDGCGDHIDQTACGPQRARRLRIADQHRELIAAEARRGVLRPDGCADPLGDLHEQLIARRVAPAVVHHLEPVEVQEQDRVRATGGRLLGERVGETLGEQQAVRQLRERVRVRLVMELFLQLGDLGQRALQPSILEQDARMARERLQEGDVLARERAHVPDPVADQHDPERALLTDEGAHQSIAETAGAEERFERMGRTPARKQDRMRRGGDRSDRSIIDRIERDAFHQPLAIGAAHAPQRILALHGRQEQDLRVIGAEQPPRGHEQLARPRDRTPGRLGSRASIRRGTRPARAVRAGAYRRGTRPAGDHRQREQEQRDRIVREELDDEQSEAAGGQGAEVDTTSTRPSCEAENSPSATAITAVDEEHADRVRHDGRQERREPRRHAGLATGDDRPEHEQHRAPTTGRARRG